MNITNTTSPSPVSRPPLPRNIPAFIVSLLFVLIAVTSLSYVAYLMAAKKMCQRKDEENDPPFHAWSDKTLHIHKLANPRKRTVRMCGGNICNRYTLLVWRTCIWLYSLVTLIFWSGTNSTTGEMNGSGFMFYTVLTWLNFCLMYLCLVVVSISDIIGVKPENSVAARLLGRVAGLYFAVAFQNSLFTDLIFYLLLSWVVPPGFMESLLNLSMHGPLNMMVLCLEIWMVDMPYAMSYITVPFIPILLYWFGWSMAFLIAPDIITWLPYWFLQFTWLLPPVIIGIFILSVGVHTLCVKLIRACDRCCPSELVETSIEEEESNTAGSRGASTGELQLKVGP